MADTARVGGRGNLDVMLGPVPCPACDGDGATLGLDGCVVCADLRGTPCGVVLPMRSDAYHRCLRVVAHLRARGMDTAETANVLDLTPGEWIALHAGTLSVVTLERVAAALGVLY